MSSYKEVWDVLSSINIDADLKKMQGLSYLPWANAWMLLMEHYPEAELEFPRYEIHEDGSVTVFCTVRIGELSRSMWLPVMDGGRHLATAKPTGRDISDAKMRCFVKCLALYGLGLYVYRGEVGPPAEREATFVPDPIGDNMPRELDGALTSYEVARLAQLLDKLPEDARGDFFGWVGYASIEDIPGSLFDRTLKGLQAKLNSMAIA